MSEAERAKEAARGIVALTKTCAWKSAQLSDESRVKVLAGRIVDVLRLSSSAALSEAADWFDENWPGITTTVEVTDELRQLAQEVNR
jgi:hypothetical protein